MKNINYYVHVNLILSIFLIITIAFNIFHITSFSILNLLNRGDIGRILLVIKKKKLVVENEGCLINVMNMSRQDLKDVFKEILEENNSPFDENHDLKYGKSYF